MIKHWRDHCGVFALFVNKSTPHKLRHQDLLKGLKELQHRGQDSCGICIYDAQSDIIFEGKQSGFVSDNLLDGYCLENFKHGIGHVRYATSHESLDDAFNIQPFVAGIPNGDFLSFVHNGHVTNAASLREILKKRGVFSESLNDSYLLFLLLKTVFMETGKLDLEEIKSVFSKVEGAYSCIVQTKNAVFAIRDPLGIRPLSVGTLRNATVFSSESMAVESNGGKNLREVKAGEILRVQEFGRGITLHSIFLEGRMAAKSAQCVFESIYFAKESSNLFSMSVRDFRSESGFFLAKTFLDKYKMKQPVIDVVIPIPDGGILAATTFAKSLSLPLNLNLIQKKKKIRSFLIKNERSRLAILSEKYSYDEQTLRNKNIVLIDDSLVRGSTLKTITKRLKTIGIKSIHVLIASPPIRFPCYYGIDTPDSNELMAYSMSEQEICTSLGIDSLTFLSQENLNKCIQQVSTKKNTSLDNDFCSACLNGTYPTDLDNKNLIVP